MSLPRWIEWPVATATLLATGLAAIGMSTMDELASYRIHLLVVGVSLCLMAGLAQLGALLAPVVRGIATTLRARGRRKAQIALEQAAFAARAQKLQAAATRIVGAWNLLLEAERKFYQPRAGETFAQASAREQLWGGQEEVGMRYLRHIVSTDYHFATAELEASERMRHRALRDRLSAADIDHVEEAIRDLVALVFSENARPTVDHRPSKASGPDRQP